MLRLRRPFAIAILSLGASLGFAPATIHARSGDDSGRGWTWYESVIGSSSSLATVTRFDSTVGYNFNRHFGVDVGAPVLFVNAASTATTNYQSATGVGDVYTDLRFTLRNPAVNFISTIRGTAPAGSTQNGFSTGRVTADWNNHFDRTFGRTTPFVDVGIANTVPDTAYFVRPYTTLGAEGHFLGGASLKIWRFLDARASAYAIEPTGEQKVFSKLLHRQSTTPGGGASHGRAFQSSPETTGTADIARDHGFSIGLNASPTRMFDLAAGYTRSATYSLNTVYFGVGFNLARFLGSSSH